MTITEDPPVPAHAAPAGLDLAASYNVAAEQAVLGAMLIAQHAIDAVSEILSPDDFYRTTHGTICQAIFNAYAAGEPTDIVAIADRLFASGDLSRVGGAPYLHELIAGVTTAASAGWHARIVATCAGRQRLSAAAATIGQNATNPGITLIEAQDRAGEALLKAVSGQEAESTSRLGDLFDDALDAIEQAGKRVGLRGITTGFSDLDKLTSGLQPGQLIVVAGRPGMGKSTVALDFLRVNAIRDGRPGLYCSLEMPKAELVNRVLAAENGIHYGAIRDGRLSDNDMARIARKMGEINQVPMFIDDGNLTLVQIRARARRIKQRYGLELLIIDYLQLMPVTSGGRDRNREREVAELSRGLKLLAKELECPVVAVSQLNRGPEQRNDKRPLMADLRESGGIENDADIVLLIHRDDYYDKESPRSGEADFIVAKNRGGAPDTVTVAARLHLSRFEDMAIL